MESNLNEDSALEVLVKVVVLLEELKKNIEEATKVLKRVSDIYNDIEMSLY